ncbi:unnamed protein product [Durusdinium trenchii]|uniref:Uncharacterized protein n=1 Tax=Durusdinium trenchii TaxID=1381693 RepID=A0ABP0QRT4_9DINO
MEVSDQFLQISNIRHEKPNCPADLDVGVPPETSSKACEAPPTVASESFLRLINLVVQQHIIELATRDKPPDPLEEVPRPVSPKSPKPPSARLRMDSFDEANSGTSSRSSNLSRKLRASRQSNNSKLQRGMTAKVMCKQHEAMPEVNASRIFDLLDDHSEELDEVKNAFKPSYTFITKTEAFLATSSGFGQCSLSEAPEFHGFRRAAGWCRFFWPNQYIIVDRRRTWLKPNTTRPR